MLCYNRLTVQIFHFLLKHIVDMVYFMDAIDFRKIYDIWPTSAFLYVLHSCYFCCCLCIYYFRGPACVTYCLQWVLFHHDCIVLALIAIHICYFDPCKSPESGIQNPTIFLLLEQKSSMVLNQGSGIQNPESENWDPESRIFMNSLTWGDEFRLAFVPFGVVGLQSFF